MKIWHTVRVALQVAGLFLTGKAGKVAKALEQAAEVVDETPPPKPPAS